MRGSTSSEVTSANRQAFERQALVKVRLELEGASARLANAGYELKPTHGGTFVADINSAQDLIASAIRAVDEKIQA